MSDLERIGRLILYRNKIMERILRELQKEFPDIDILLEEFVRLLEAIDDLDNDTIATIAKLKEKPPIEIKKTEEGTKEVPEADSKEVEAHVPFEDWVVSVVNSIDGSDTARNYVLQLKNFGGVALTSQLVRALGVERSTVALIEKNLESKGVIKSIPLFKWKMVYFNHPDILSMRLDDIQSVFKKHVKLDIGFDTR